MQQYLENLRKKPKAVRAQVAFGTAGSITAIFFLLWAFGLSDRMSVDSNDPTIAAYERDVAQKELTTRSQEAGFGSLFGQLKRSVASIIFSNEVYEPEDVNENKSIDINAIIENPQPKFAAPTTSIDVLSKKNDDDAKIKTGATILIGTTTTSKSETNE